MTAEPTSDQIVDWVERRLEGGQTVFPGNYGRILIADWRRLKNEVAIWKSVFPDIAPERVLPDRSKLESELRRLKAENKLLRARMEICYSGADVDAAVESERATCEAIARNFMRSDEFSHRPRSHVEIADAIAARRNERQVKRVGVWARRNPRRKGLAPP